MKEEFEIKLQEEFPFIKRDMSIKERNTIHNLYQAWGCECSAGWYSLIRELCQEITKRYAEDGIVADNVDLEVLQIKEKFDVLFNNVDAVRQVFSTD